MNFVETFFVKVQFFRVCCISCSSVSVAEFKSSGEFIWGLEIFSVFSNCDQFVQKRVVYF